MYRHCAALLFLLVTVNAHAIPVVWTLDNVVFDDGGIATGSFVYDADLSIYSDVDITTTDGADLMGSHYLYSTFFNINGFVNGVTDVDQADLTGASAFFMGFGQALNNSGGTVSLFGGFGPTLESVCGVPDCSLSVGEPNLRELISGSVVGTVVPIPAALWLFGSALAGLGWLRRKQTA